MAKYFLHFVSGFGMGEEDYSPELAYAQGSTSSALRRAPVSPLSARG